MRDSASHRADIRTTEVYAAAYALGYSKTWDAEVADWFGCWAWYNATAAQLSDESAWQRWIGDRA